VLTAKEKGCRNFRRLRLNFFQVFEVFEAFRHHQMTDKQDYWHFEEIQNGGGRQLVFAKMVILATLYTLGCPFASPLFFKCKYKSNKP